MIKNGYEETYDIKYSDQGQNLALKPFALLNFMQNVAVQNADDLGFGYTYMTPRHMGWYLLKYRMEFEKYPRDIKKLTVRTKSRGYNKLFAYRDFELYTENELCARITSLWAVVDLQTKSMVSITSAFENMENLSPFEKEDDDLSYAKLKPIDSIDIEKEFEVFYDDIDTNGHANNGHYIVWALEPLSYKFRTNHVIKTIDMHFKKEVCYGEKIISQVQIKDELTTAHVLKNAAGEDIFMLECKWGNL